MLRISGKEGKEWKRKKNISEMTKEEILRQQLELLAEASMQCACDEIGSLTHAMVELVKLLG